MRTSVVILSGHSLFTAGIARRLQQYLELVEMETIDPRQLSVMPRLAAAQPSVVILDITDPDVARLCPLSKLLTLLPELKIICLDPRQSHIQVVTGEQHTAVEVRELAEVIEQLM